MIQDQFKALAADIVANAKRRYNYFSLPALKLEVIQEMGAQLEALRLSYNQMTGDNVDLPTFNQTMSVPVLA